MPMVGNMSGPPGGQARAITSDPLRLASIAQDRPSIFRRNPERGLPAMTGARVEGLNGDIAEPGYRYFP